MTPDLETDEDHCALTPVRRAAALLDRDPASLRAGDALPRGWHFLLFTPLTRQSALGADGFEPAPAGLGLERPRLMMGGRRARYLGDIAIGQPVRRTRRLLSLVPKQGRSGRLMIATRRQEIFTSGGRAPVLVEDEDLVYREAAPAAPAPAAALFPAAGEPADHSRVLTPDEALLFRYSALTFNTHRIHFDQPYATGVEGYPGLVVNGGLTTLLLLEFGRGLHAGPVAETRTRGLRPLFAGQPMTLKALRSTEGWRLWAENGAGETAMEMQIR